MAENVTFLQVFQRLRHISGQKKGNAAEQLQCKSKTKGNVAEALDA